MFIVIRLCKELGVENDVNEGNEINESKKIGGQDEQDVGPTKKFESDLSPTELESLFVARESALKEDFNAVGHLGQPIQHKEGGVFTQFW